jgi:hypothetical protein
MALGWLSASERNEYQNVCLGSEAPLAENLTAISEQIV